MAPNADADTGSKSASKKKRKNKKKGADKSAGADDTAHPTDPTNGAAEDEDGDEEGEDEADAPRNASVVEPATEKPQESRTEDLPLRNGDHAAKSMPGDDVTARLDAAERERDTLRAEVAELRKSLESIQTKHEEDLGSIREQKEEAEAAKEKADSQYQTLLGRVNTIRSQLGDRLKADAEELSLARSQIEELEQKNSDLRKTQDDKQQTITKLQDELNSQKSEVNSIRSRSNLSTTNWSKERDELNSQLAYAKEEFENAKQAMQDWEVLAMEERSLRESLGEKVGELEDQVVSHREAHERAINERDLLNNTVEGLQRALQEIQEARKRELRETVEASEAKLEALKKQADEAAKRATESVEQLQSTKKELERALPFEKEVKEKNLLIGKLRHEAVILNDHLTKALRFLKRGKPEDNVDRQVVTNHFLHFLALDRSDPKKFQILQLIAALLGWSDEQREQAGLSRPGASNAQLRVPLSPFRRTPSTPSLSTDYIDNSGGQSRESLAELWSDFLEREAEAGGGSRATSRRGSIAASQRSGSVISPPPRGEQSGMGLRGSISGQNSHPSVPEEA
ncbi:GRIP-related Arf-binding domain-containing protein [Elsinoe fawcettii]|nr:GRIP-related Arf-binding domain-containing protein [Elsinoe fawcettii]